LQPLAPANLQAFSGPEIEFKPSDSRLAMLLFPPRCRIFRRVISAAWGEGKQAEELSTGNFSRTLLLVSSTIVRTRGEFFTAWRREIPQLAQTLHLPCICKVQQVIVAFYISLQPAESPPPLCPS